MHEARGSALRLAAHLRSLAPTELAHLVDARDIRSTGISDYIDLAEALLDPHSIQDAVAKLERSAIAVIAVAADLGTATPSTTVDWLVALDAHDDMTTPELVARRLTEAVRLGLGESDDSGAVTIWPVVGDVITDWPAEGILGLRELVTAPPPPTLAAVDNVDPRFIDRGAAERAFAATTAVTELVSALQREPARLLSRGGIALPDLRRLAQATATELDDVADIVAIAARAALVAPDASRWLPTTDAHAWLGLPASGRWGVLAGAWIDRLPSDIRSLLASRAHAAWGDQLDAYLEWLFPAGGERMRARIRQYTHHAELLGITAKALPTSPGVALLGGDTARAVSTIADLFPTEVHHVYFQHDLSVVAPGPLAAAIDERLRGIADVEGRSLASHYRVSAASLTRALAAGETPESIREFFSEIALTGIPQPLDYLITDTSARHGSVRVGHIAGGDPGATGARSYVRSIDPHLLGTILIDHSLSSLGFQRRGNRLLSRATREAVFWALAQARYPVAAEAADGSVEHIERQHTTSPVAGHLDSSGSDLAERLRASAPDDASELGVWLTRQLEAAIRGKFAVRVTVELADGLSVEYLLEPTSIAAGRLRARDRRADLERTLPLSRITGLAAL